MAWNGKVMARFGATNPSTETVKCIIQAAELITKVSLQVTTQAGSTLQAVPNWTQGLRATD